MEDLGGLTVVNGCTYPRGMGEDKLVLPDILSLACCCRRPLSKASEQKESSLEWRGAGFLRALTVCELQRKCVLGLSPGNSFSVISRKQGAGSEGGTEPCVMTLKRAHVGFVYFRGQFCLSIVVLIDLDVL